MQRSYYSARIREFLDEKPETLLGKLMVSDEFSRTSCVRLKTVILHSSTQFRE